MNGDDQVEVDGRGCVVALIACAVLWAIVIALIVWWLS